MSGYTKIYPLFLEVIMEFYSTDIKWRSLLIRLYKKYGLNDLDLAVIFVIDELITMDRFAIITPENISEYMTSSEDDIDSSISRLIEKGYLETKTDNNFELKYSLKPLFKKILDDLKKDIIIEDKIELSEAINSEVNVYTGLEQILGRSLAPVDKRKIDTLLSSGIPKEDILSTAEFLSDNNDLTISRLKTVLTKQNKEKKTAKQVLKDEDKEAEDLLINFNYLDE